MLLLRNNYFAWLLEAKKALPTLVTDYCAEQRRRGNFEIDMTKELQESLLVGEADG